MARGKVACRRHILHPGRVAPVVVEVKERADSNGIVDGLIRPSRAANPLDILRTNAVRFPVDLFQEFEEGPLFLRCLSGQIAR